ncbi:hypothetical protein MUP37_01120, partial [Candidatus Bathyarchaeota archaeon]|nr:hypothetical protein [Candidatus Bathyarchaeota archaeon]
DKLVGSRQRHEFISSGFFSESRTVDAINIAYASYFKMQVLYVSEDVYRVSQRALSITAICGILYIGYGLSNKSSVVYQDDP